jgi:PAS domain S-box-containing protein
MTPSRTTPIPPLPRPDDDKSALEALARRAAELEVVAQVGLAATTILDSAELLQTVVDLTQERFKMRVVTVGLVAADGRTLYIGAGAGPLGRQLMAAGLTITIEHHPSLVALAARTRQSIVANDVLNHPDYWAHPLLTSTRSELVTPIIVGDRLLGLLDVQSEEPDHFGPDEVRVLGILAAQLGIALENARRFEELQKFSARLEESRQFLDSIFENIPTAIFVKEAAELRMVRANKANEILTGRRSDDLIGKTDYELFPPEEARFFATKDHELLATRQMVEIPEQHIQRTDGDIRLIHTRKVPIAGSDGNVKFILGISEDITERRKLEQTIQASWERRGRQVQVSTEVAQEIAAAPALDELFWRVVDLVQTRFGYYYVQVYTLENEELRLQAGSGEVGRRLKEAGHKIMAVSPLSIIAQAAQTAVPVLVPDVFQEPKWLPNIWLPDTRCELAVPIQLRHEILGVLDVQHDIVGGLTPEDQILLAGLCGQIAIAMEYRRVDARRQHAENQLKMSLTELEINNRELQEFAFIASHDLQEPLRKIQALSDRLQLLFGADMDERAHDYLNRLRQAAAHTQLFITDYLAFSRVSAMPQVCTATDLTAVVQAVLHDFEPAIQEAQAEITVTTLPTIEAELSQIHLLFRHLIGNALKFRQPDRPPVIHISGHRLPETNSCQITVQDNGIGFDERHADRIFRVFQRLHGRQDYEGTGMGLAICRKVAERHHGRIQATSTPGQGATFTITLPLHQPVGDEVIK